MAKLFHMSTRSRYQFLLLIAAAVFICSFLPGNNWLLMSAASAIQWSHGCISTLGDSNFWQWDRLKDSDQAVIQPQIPQSTLENDFFTWENPDMPRRSPIHKPPREPSLPVPDPFPLLSQYPPPKRSLLRGPKVNRPPYRHYSKPTPLLVGFTRNWPQLLQCVVSYIAAGWPPEDIHVVENTGVMHANRDGNLTLQNPFYLNHTQLDMLGVNVIITPTLLTFAQLQNFYLWTALSKDWPHFFWTHQDLLVFSYESTDTTIPNPHLPRSLYRNAVAVLRFLSTTNAPKWAHHFFDYDHLTLVNRDVVLSLGGWDTHIPYYSSDCDTYVRAMWAGFWQGESNIGLILDVGSVMEDLGALLRIKGVRGRLPPVPVGVGDGDVEAEGGVNGTTTTTTGQGVGVEVEEKADGDGDGDGDYVETWERLVELGYEMEGAKYSDGNAWRNTWQIRQRGGQNEPFYRDAEGFETGIKMMIDTGRAVFAEKWGHRGCDIARAGINAADAWRLERDWDEETEGKGNQGKGW